MKYAIRRSIAWCLAAAALSGCMVGNQAKPASEGGTLSVQLLPREDAADHAEAPVRYEASLLDARGAVVATREVPADAAALSFDGVPQGSYTLTVKARSRSGRAVNADAPAASRAGTFHVGWGRDTIGQAMVPMLLVDGGNRLGPSGRLSLDLAFGGGGISFYEQGPVVADVSKPATEGHAAAPGALSTYPTDGLDDDARCYLKNEIAPSLSHKFTAFTTTREGADAVYLGPATLQMRSGVDAENGDQPTLLISYPDHALKLYMDAEGALIAGGSPYPSTGTPGSFAYLDPEPVAGAVFHNEQHPTGTPARRYYWQLADYGVADLYMGPQANDGLYAFHLPMGDRVLHIVRL